MGRKCSVFCSLFPEVNVIQVDKDDIANPSLETHQLKLLNTDVFAINTI